MPAGLGEYSARSVKQAVVGTGAADKSQVQMMIVQLLKLSEAPAEGLQQMRWRWHSATPSPPAPTV